MSDDYSGAGSRSFRAQRFGTAWSTTSGADPVGYEDSLTESVSGGPSRPLVGKPTFARPRADRSDKKKQPAARPETRYALRTSWVNAQLIAAKMIAAADNGDPVDLTSLATDLDYVLDDMWLLREARNLDWRTILDFAQGVMKHAFKEKRFGEFTIEQCRALHRVIGEFLGPNTVDKDDVRESMKTLRRAGFDIWSTISGTE